MPHLADLKTEVDPFPTKSLFMSQTGQLRRYNSIHQKVAIAVRADA